MACCMWAPSTYGTYGRLLKYQRYQGAYVYNKLVRFFAYTTLANWA